MDIPSLVTPKDRKTLEAPISEEEIKKAIWSLHPDKSPGSDGFTIRFYRLCWKLIKKDLLHLISWMSKGKMGGETNYTFLALFLKSPTPPLSNVSGQSLFVMLPTRFSLRSYL